MHILAAKRSFRSKLLAATLLFSAFQYSEAQTEWIVSAGSSHFLGDLGGKFSPGSLDFADLDLQSTRFMVGAGLRKYFGNHFALRGNLYYGRLSANDKYTTYLPRQNRNLNFFSPITGANLLAECHFKLNRNKSNQWYIFAGVEHFFFNPKTRYNGHVIDLQPLGTEGQNFLPGKSPYDRHSWAIPMGLGYKFKSHHAGHWSIELNGRKTFTDYIDDVSTQYADKNQLYLSGGQLAVDLSDRSLGLIEGFSNTGNIRGNPGYNDNFFFITLNYTHIIGQASSKGKGLFKKNNQCFEF